MSKPPLQENVLGVFPKQQLLGLLTAQETKVSCLPGKWLHFMESQRLRTPMRTWEANVYSGPISLYM